MFIVWYKWLNTFADIHKNLNKRNEKKLAHGRNFLTQLFLFGTVTT